MGTSAPENGIYGISGLWDLGIMGFVICGILVLWEKGGEEGRNREKGRARALVHHEVLAQVWAFRPQMTCLETMMADPWPSPICIFGDIMIREWETGGKFL